MGIVYTDNRLRDIIAQSVYSISDIHVETVRLALKLRDVLSTTPVLSRSRLRTPYFVLFYTLESILVAELSVIIEHQKVYL